MWRLLVKLDAAMTTINLNGRAYDIAAEADTPVLWVLRDTLGLTGTKYELRDRAVWGLHGVDGWPGDAIVPNCRSTASVQLTSAPSTPLSKTGSVARSSRPESRSNCRMRLLPVEAGDGRHRTPEADSA
jgi:hypothetical protein